MTNYPNSIHDAQWRLARSKFPNQGVEISNLDIPLVAAAALAIAKPVVTGNMGRPTNANLYMSVSAACNLTLSASIDGINWFKVQTVNFTGAGTSMIQVPCGPYAKITTDADLVTATVIVSPNYY